MSASDQCAWIEAERRDSATPTRGCFVAAIKVADLRAYAARMKAERDAWSEEAGRLGLALAKLRAEKQRNEGGL